VTRDWRDERIDELEAQLRSRDGRIDELEAQLRVRDERIGVLEQQVATLMKQVAELAAKLELNAVRRSALRRRRAQMGMPPRSLHAPSRAM
jgi:chromosome segregation ATPase